MPDLVGRAGECAALEELIGDVRGGTSRSLVVWGEAGIGKTALLEHLIGAASGLTVIRATGVQSEKELAYAGLHQLCAPLLDRLAALPGPQRHALEIVFGRSSGAAPDRLLVGLGMLTLLSEAGTALLCVVDDAQWLDQASMLALAFAARRLHAEPVGLVFAARERGAALEPLPELEVRGLRDGDARRLLTASVPFFLNEELRERIVAETGGNPLALIELPRELAGGFGPPEPQALSGRLEQSFARRIGPLPADTRRLLLIAAADPVGDPLLLWGAAERLGIAPAAAGALEAGDLLAIGPRVTFRHPLVRSAVYRAAELEDRRAVHLALAEVTDPAADPDRRAWHLAAATLGPDERVAAELERSAGRARARGGVAATAAFLERAVALSGDPARRVERALAASQAHLQAGAFDAARRLLAGAEAGSLDDAEHARVALLRGQIEFTSNLGGDAAALLLKAARRLETLDPALARQTYLDAWGAAYYAGDGSVREVSRAALAAPQPTSAPRPSDVLLDALATLVAGGRAAAAPKLRAAVRFATHGEVAEAERLRWAWGTALPAIMLWDDESWHRMIVRRLQSVREAGLLAFLPFQLHSPATHMVLRGELATAASLIAEADAIAEATGTRHARYAATALAGFRGREAEAVRLIEAQGRDAGQGLGVQSCHRVASTLYNGLGRYERALPEARRASAETPELYGSQWALPELIEAAARTGQTELAADALERLAEATSIGDSDWGLGIYARSRALLSDDESAYREAIERLGRTRIRTELARAHLLYGEWLRRRQRRVDARASLRTAYDQLAAIGMEAFAERARTELLATGEIVRRRSPETRDDLTAQELRIAGLAQDGLANAEIGARLFLSPRTVEWHLRNVYAKLGVSSRRGLSSALLEPTQPTP